MKVLITGGAGVLGSVLGSYLIDHGYMVTLFNIVPCNSPIRSIQGDILNSKDLLNAMKGHDVVVHCASLHGVHIPYRSEKDFLMVNVLGTLNVLEAAKVCGVKRFIYASSTSVYGVSRRIPRNKAV